MQNPPNSLVEGPARELCGIVLHPAGHTLSPVLHGAAYAALGLNAVYRTFDVAPHGLEGAVAEMRALGMRQLSVSLPHKEAALKLADRISSEAQQIGAANTLTRMDDAIVADNTDWVGVLRTLEPHGPWKGRRATVLGAGGAARAVVYALRSLDMDVLVTNRTLERASRLVDELGGRVGSIDEPYDLLVNATPLGMHPEVDASPIDTHQLQPAALVFDTVYRPLETRLLREANAKACRTQDGLDMLVHQAVEQIRLWSNRTPDPALLRQAADQALHGHAAL